MKVFLPGGVGLVGLNLIGLRRAGMARDRIALLKAAWLLLADRRLSRAQALDEILALEPAAPELLELVEFVRASKRGLCRAGRCDDARGVEAG